MARNGVRKMGKVIIIEPAEEQRCAMAEALAGFDVQVCADLREFTQESQPAVLVLGLHSMEELIFLQELGEDRPGVVVCTAYCNEQMARHLQKYCDHILYAPYNLSLLHDHVADLLDGHGRNLPLCEDAASQIVRQLLKRPARDGYRYLIAALRLYSVDTMPAVTKEIYPAVAKEFGSTAACVEKAIRTAIDQAYDERDDAIWRRYFPKDRSGQVICPGNKAFFALLARHIQDNKRRWA